MIHGSQADHENLNNHSTSIFYRSMVVFEGAANALQTPTTKFNKTLEKYC